MACISVGSFHLAIKQLGLQPIDTEDLVAISQVSRKSRKKSCFVHVYVGSGVMKNNKFKTWQTKYF